MHEQLTGSLAAAEIDEHPLVVTDGAYPIAATLIVPSGTTPAGSVNFDLELRASGGALVAQTKLPGTPPGPGWPPSSGRQEDLGFDPAATGTHVLRVKSVSGAGAYLLDVSRGPAPAVGNGKPQISGTPRDGETLTATTGTWGGLCASLHAFRWLRCTVECAEIDGAAAAGYELTPEDVAAVIRVRVVATNATGSTQAESEPTGPVLAAPPLNTAPPTISGIARDNETLAVHQRQLGGHAGRQSCLPVASLRGRLPRDRVCGRGHVHAHVRRRRRHRPCPRHSLERCSLGGGDLGPDPGGRRRAADLRRRGQQRPHRHVGRRRPPRPGRERHPPGAAGDDRLYGGAGADLLFGGAGLDTMLGGRGNDRVSSRDAARDTVSCGAGVDVVTADRCDRVARDCERVTRR